MHLAGVVLTVLGAWLILAMPTALLVGRFLRVGSERGQATAEPISNDSFGSSAA